MEGVLSFMLTKKISVAGPLVRECICSRATSREPATVRQEKRKTSSEAQQRMNAKYSWEKLEMMLAANFVPGDLVVTLTFDDDHLPPDRKTAAAKLKKFRAELAKLRSQKDSELRMIWTLENKSDAGRWHVHLAMNSTGEDYEDIRACWPFGPDAEITRLQVNKKKNYETLARYMCKEARERAGLRSWSYTRSCRHPETETFTVPDDTRLTAPEGSTVIVEESVRTAYAEFQYIKYLATAPIQLHRQRPRAKRRR